MSMSLPEHRNPLAKGNSSTGHATCCAVRANPPAPLNTVAVSVPLGTQRFPLAGAAPLVTESRALVLSSTTENLWTQ